MIGELKSNQSRRLESKQSPHSAVWKTVFQNNGETPWFLPVLLLLLVLIIAAKNRAFKKLFSNPFRNASSRGSSLRKPEEGSLADMLVFDALILQVM
jgi:hypothetical protein